MIMIVSVGALHGHWQLPIKYNNMKGSASLTKYYSALLITCVFSMLQSTFCKAQIQDVFVEKYYIADSLDATDTVNGTALEKGMVTYRIYVDLVPGSRIRSIYGDVNHPIQIKSTASIYNSLQQGDDFGYEINKNFFIVQPSLALDSWLTLGLAAKNQSGVPKLIDLNGNSFAGSLNTGGSSSIPAGLLNNADTACGVPLTTSDGLMPYPVALSTWLDDGFKDASGIDTTIFGTSLSNEFLSYNSFLQQIAGVRGSAADSTIVLVGQITTKGELSFKLNLEVEQNNGGTTTVVKYVSSNTNIQSDEVVEPLLIYPPVCGCTDASYLEYSAIYSCNDPDSCTTLIKYGCTDPVACNYDPDVNFNIPEMCCYPGLCQDRDIAIVCPQLNNLRESKIDDLFPSPAQSVINLGIKPSVNGVFLSYTIKDISGKIITEENIGSVSGDYYLHEVNISDLRPGSYFMIVNTGDKVETKKFIVVK